MDVTTENYQLKWHSFGNHLHSCVAAALHGDYFTDVALLTVDGRQILAHRFILSACSQYLNQVLKLQTKVSMNTPLIIILPPEINYKTLKVLIQYMYSGETTVSQEILESVLRGGDILKVKGLWRPREEDGADKRMNVRLHQRVGSSNGSTPAPTPTPEQLPVKELCKTPKPKHKPGITKENNNKEPTECNKVVKENEESSVIKATPVIMQDEKGGDAKIKTPDIMQVLVIKEEPIEWAEVTEEDIALVEQSELFEGDLMIKPEVQLEEFEDIQEEMYTPLTCELCSETFTIPADWVKHVQTHTDMMPAKRQKRGRPSSDDEDPGTFPPLQCDMCQEFFSTPAKWVQHIQSAHTEQELHANNTNKPVRAIRSSSSRIVGPTHKACTICMKKFPSHASMLIHRRTHTGERPYMCHYCCKGFNVKSNLLRHLRTLHDKCVNPNDIDGKDEETDDV